MKVYRVRASLPLPVVNRPGEADLEMASPIEQHFATEASARSFEAQLVKAGAMLGIKQPEAYIVVGEVEVHER